MSSLIILNEQQGSDAWLKARLGVITASNAHALLLSKNSKTPKYKEARETYMLQLINEICTGQHEEINAKALEWGKLNEDAAIAAYELISGKEVEKISLVYKDESRRAGASADFRLPGQNHGGECKCPINGINHLNFILNSEIKDEYMTQMQFGMFCTGWDFWDFTSYNPRMPKKMLHYVTIERDLELMSYFDYEVPKFIYEMDQKLAQLGFKFGDQWK